MSSIRSATDANSISGVSVVALLIFALGASVAFYDGIAHIRNPARIEDPTINYIVLALSIVFESISWWVAVRQFQKHRGKLGFIEAATRSRDPSTYLVLFEDTAALSRSVISAKRLTWINQADPDQSHTPRYRIASWH